jgi:hypothetical protein
MMRTLLRFRTANEVPQCRLQQFALLWLRGNGRMLSVAMVAAPQLNHA